MRVPFKCGVRFPAPGLDGVFGGSEQDMIEKVQCPILAETAVND